MRLRQFSKQWGLSANALTEVRERALSRLGELMAKKSINSLADII
jgi:hypothetical protein